MPVLNQDIQFKFGLQSAYEGIETKDVNTIYVTTDKQRLYIGETEVTRPIAHGTTLPETMVPPDSLFVLENGTARTLYYSKSGATWEMISVLPANITGGVFGENTAGAVTSVKIPKLTVDTHGFITAVEDVTVSIPEETKNTVVIDGEGNAVTAATWDEAGHQLTLTKETLFVTKAQLDEAVGGLVKMDYVMVDTYDNLPETGVKGTIYLVPHTHSDENDSYDEYLWLTDKYEKIGNTDVDLSGYVPNTRTINGQALTEDITITTITGNAGTATKLATARNINVSGAATGVATAFDGSKDISIEVTSIEGSKVSGEVPKATQAIQDGDGNVLTTTYATNTALNTAVTEAKTELEGKIEAAQTAATLKWGTF